MTPLPPSVLWNFSENSSVLVPWSVPYPEKLLTTSYKGNVTFLEKGSKNWLFFVTFATISNMFTCQQPHSQCFSPLKHLEEEKQLCSCLHHKTFSWGKCNELNGGCFCSHHLVYLSFAVRILSSSALCESLEDFDFFTRFRFSSTP